MANPLQIFVAGGGPQIGPAPPPLLLNRFSSVSVSDFGARDVPPPPSSPATEIFTFDLTSTFTGTAPFTVGLAFKKGDVPSGQAPALDIASQQVIVKRAWNDGSVKHAIASGSASLSAGVPLSVSVLDNNGYSGTNLTETDLASVVTAAGTTSVQCGSIGTVALTSLLGNPFRTWIQGPQMIECHYRQALSSQALVVWFHVRYYASGDLWIRAIVERGYVDISSQTNLWYMPTVIIGGNVIYTNNGANLNHYYYTRWCVDGWVGSDKSLSVKHDTLYLMQTNLVPTYWKRNPSAAAISSMTQIYSPMIKGKWTETMGDTGYQDQIGILSRWDSLYLNSGGDSGAYDAVITHSKALGSYPIVWRDSNNNLPTIPSLRATWTVYGPGTGGDTSFPAGTGFSSLASSISAGATTISAQSGAGANFPFAGGGSTFDIIIQQTISPFLQSRVTCTSRSGDVFTVTPVSNSFPAGTPFRYARLIWDVAHHGSGGYLAYLLTGDYFHLETLQLQASLCYLIDSSTHGSGTNRTIAGQTRGRAWTMRTLGQLAAIGPTSDSVVSDYRTLLDHNVTVGANRATQAGHNLIGYTYAYEVGANAYGTGVMAPWQYHFFIQTMGYLRDIEPLGSTTDLFTMLDYMYTAIVGILGPVGASNYCYAEAGEYNIKISDTQTFSMTDFYDSWGTVYTQTQGHDNTSCSASLTGGSGSDPAGASTGYWGNLLPAISYAYKHGATGASDSWDRLVNATNWNDVSNSGFDDTPQFGIVNNPIAGLQAGTWYEVPNSNLSAVYPSPIAVGNPAAVMYAWCGGIYDTKRDRLICWGGGHTDYAGSEIYAFDVNALKWIRLTDPYTATTIQCADFYPDGSAAPTHTYSTQDYAGNIDKLVKVCKGSYGSCTVDKHTYYFDFDTLQWTKSVNAFAVGSFGNETSLIASYDSATGLMWGHGTTDASKLASFDITSGVNGTWTYYGPLTSLDFYKTSAIDPNRHIMIACGNSPYYPASPLLPVWDLDNPSILPVDRGHGTSEAIELAPGPGIAFHPPSGKFVGWIGGTSVHVLDPDTWNWSTIPAATQNTVDPGNPTVNPGSGTIGSYGRWRYVPSLDVFVIVSSTTGHVFFYRLPSGI